MNDITALMATMKAAAELIAPGYKRNWIVSHDDETCWVGANDDDGNLTPFIEVSIGDWSDNKTDNERLAAFIALAHPANVRALVEALEAEQQKSAKQGRHACELFDEVKQLQEQLRTVELSNSVLESRTVTVKLPKPTHHRANIGTGEWFTYDADDVDNALTAAGIQVIEGEGQ